MRMSLPAWRPRKKKRLRLRDPWISKENRELRLAAVKQRQRRLRGRSLGGQLLRWWEDLGDTQQSLLAALCGIIALLAMLALVGSFVYPYK